MKKLLLGLLICSFIVIGWCSSSGAKTYKENYNSVMAQYPSLLRNYSNWSGRTNPNPADVAILLTIKQSNIYKKWDGVKMSELATRLLSESEQFELKTYNIVNAILPGLLKKAERDNEIAKIIDSKVYERLHARGIANFSGPFHVSPSTNRKLDKYDLQEKEWNEWYDTWKRQAKEKGYLGREYERWIDMSRRHTMEDIEHDRKWGN